MARAKEPWCRDVDPVELADVVTDWASGDLSYDGFCAYVKQVRARRGEILPSDPYKRSNIQTYLPTAIRYLHKMGFRLTRR